MPFVSSLLDKQNKANKTSEVFHCVYVHINVFGHPFPFHHKKESVPKKENEKLWFISPFTSLPYFLDYTWAFSGAREKRSQLK